MSVSVTTTTETTTYDLSEVDWASLPAEQKVEIIKAMGFSRQSEPHQPDCPRGMFGSGYICQCVPPSDRFCMADDVAEHLGQTWGQRRDRRRRQVDAEAAREEAEANRV